MVTYARTIEKLIDETSLDIFKEYKNTLLAEPNSYIVPAVWGVVKDGELTREQKEIFMRIHPVMTQVLRLLKQDGLSDTQEFAIGYLVRGLFISKIIYMIEFYKNLAASRTDSAAPHKALKDIEPWGHA